MGSFLFLSFQYPVYNFQVCSDKWEDGGIIQDGMTCPNMDNIEMEPNLSPPGQVRMFLICSYLLFPK